MKRKNLAAKITLVVAMTACTFQPTYAGIPVVDGTNLSQNIMSAMEAVAQTLKQIQEYQTQLQQ
ncbi:conjugal transfer protein TrbJ, partial [Marinobacter sp. Z-F4-2]